jgi:hypothetical protein
MKYLFSIALLLLTRISSDSKLELICHSWVQVGIKPFQKEFHAVNTQQGEVLTFRPDGTYEQLLYGSLSVNGVWRFSSDSTKFAFAVTSMNGNPIKSLPLENTKPTDSLLRLTADTLIYARLAYYGPDQIYGHDDWYYVRKK